jgi:histidinol-phosphate aminotransferase
MSRFLNKYVKNMQEYSVASHQIWEEGRDTDLLKIDWNESTINPSHVVKDRIQSLLNDNSLNLYPNVCNVKFKKALSEYAKVDTSYIEYFSGSDAVHEYLRVFLEEGSRVLILGPTYDNFRIPIQTVGASISYSMILTGNFDLLKFKQDIDKINPKMVYICNPNNPTGGLISNTDISQLVQSYQDTLFIIDEAYYEFSKETSATLVEFNDNIIICRTFSKAFGLAGLRVGYVIAHPSLILSINKVKNSKSISTFAQEGALAALQDVTYMERYVSEVIKTRENFKEMLQIIFGDNITINNSDANYLMVNFKSLDIKKIVFKHLISDNIFVRDLQHINELKSSLRFTIGTKDQMQKVTDSLNAISL